MAAGSIGSWTSSDSLMVYVPEARSSIRGRMWLAEPSSMPPAEAAAFLGQLADLRSWIAASEAIAVETVRRGFCEEAAAAARRAGQPERLRGAMDHALTVAEVASAQGISEYAAARKVNAAEALGGPLLAVLEALESGDIAEADANVMVDQARELEPDDAELFAQEALQRVRTRSGRKRTASELRPVLKSLRERLHPETIRRRAARAAGDRGVWFRPEPDGMCTVSAFLPATTGLALYAGVDAAARVVRETDPADPRTLPQLRADVLANALLTKIPAPIVEGHVRSASDEGTGRNAGESLGGSDAQSVVGARDRVDAGTSFGTPDPAEGIGLKAEIVVLIPVSTLLGNDEEAAMLEGYGPIDADVARELAVAAPTWQRLCTDDDGVPLSLGRTTYRPPAGLRRFIAYRDGVCRFPGCNRPARRAEVDHLIEWQDGGMTDARNLQSLCRKHHAIKSVGAWKATRVQDDEVTVGERGDIHWKSPLGLEYQTGPAEYETAAIVGGSGTRGRAPRGSADVAILNERRAGFGDPGRSDDEGRNGDQGRSGDEGRNGDRDCLSGNELGHPPAANCDHPPGLDEAPPPF